MHGCGSNRICTSGTTAGTRITTVEIHRSRPDWFLFTDGVTAGPPDHPGETPEQVGERADRVLAKVEAPPRSRTPRECVVLVAHGHFLRVLTARHPGFPASDGALFQLEHGDAVPTGYRARAAGDRRVECQTSV